MGSKPKAPKIVIPEPQPLPAPPKRSDVETEALAEEQTRKALSNRRGRARTFLTAGGTSEVQSASRFLAGGS
jgi:hypothetical protein